LKNKEQNITENKINPTNTFVGVDALVSKPYYEQDGITIYNANSMDVLDSLTPIDCIITDPPYGLNFGYDVYEDKPELHKEKIKEWMSTLRRVSNKIALNRKTKIRNRRH